MLQMIALRFACEESIDGLEALDIERRQIGARDGAVVRRNRVDGDVQRVMPAGAAIAILPGGQRDHQQHQQQDQDAQHLERRPPRRAAGAVGRATSIGGLDAEFGRLRRLSAAYRTPTIGLQHTGQSSI